ncbi:MAG: phage BR0599 family protein, partial [Pseudomonadota bacterium]
ETDAQTCDQRYETCRDVFANVENFRGFPHLPGNDAILAGPAATDNDGGKR